MASVTAPLILILICGFLAFLWTVLAPSRHRLKALIVGSLPALLVAAGSTETLANPLTILFLLLMFAPSAAGALAGAAAGAALARRRAARRPS